MTEELKDEIKKMREEMENLKEQLKSMTEKGQVRERGFRIDIGGPMHDYMEEVMQGVAEGVQGELEKSIFIGPRGYSIMKHCEHPTEETEEKIDHVKVAKIMSALGHEHRLKILGELMTGGKYINELQEQLPDITTSTLSSHLNVLEEAGLVVQEKVRGRYLITIPGRTAYKMARKVTRFFSLGDRY